MRRTEPASGGPGTGKEGSFRMARQIRIGVAGCGKIARVSHIPALNAVPGAKVTALCDSDHARMVAVEKELAPGAAMFDTYPDLVASDLDAVTICTPNDLHCPMALAAFKAGLHVLCEKPIAGTLADADRMIAAAGKAGRVLHINQSLRYGPAYAKLADLVASGRIGAPLHIRCIRAGGSTPDKSWSPGAAWFVSKKHQGGIILDIAIHMADLMRWVVGDVAEVAALVDTRTRGIDVPDNVRALFRFANGATGLLELSWTFPAGGGLLEIYGTEGRIRTGFTEQPIELVRQQDGKTRTTYPKPKRGVKDSFGSFVAAIKGRAPSPTPGELGRHALALCDAIVRSGESGRFEKVSPRKAGATR